MDPRKSRPAAADAERRLADLAVTIRGRQGSTPRSRRMRARPQDDFLYRRLRPPAGSR